MLIHSGFFRSLQMEALSLLHCFLQHRTLMINIHDRGEETLQPLEAISKLPMRLN